jgi:NADH dehydrogenase
MSASGALLTPSDEKPHAGRQRVVVVGGGFGGLYLVKSLKRAAVDITLIDRRNFHLFQPLLYQVATGGLSPANIAAPLRSVLQRQRNARVLLGEVTGIDVEVCRVMLADEAIPFDTLVVAAGAESSYFGHDEWRTRAPGLKSLEDATEIRRRILTAFESAERARDPATIREWLTFVVIGGGPTGVELAGTLAEIARYTLRREFRRIDPANASIILIEGVERVLGNFIPELSERARASLQRLGVKVRTGCRVTEINDREVLITGSAGREAIACRTVLWAAGVQAAPLARVLAESTGCALDRSGRVIVEPDCSIRGRNGVHWPNIFVIGDMALLCNPSGQPLPGVCPVAMQQGHYVAGLIARRAAGRPDTPRPPFRYSDRGNMATIGRAAAVADLGFVRLSGYPAWLAWLLLHILFLIEFQNRILVLMQWAWNYFTWDRSARLITGEPNQDAAKSKRQD